MIKREAYMQKITPFFKKDIVKVLTGIRRCGKSVMLQLIKEELLKTGIKQEQILFVNFESRSLPETQNLDSFYEFVKSKIKPGEMLFLLLDEIQELAGWEKIINSLMIDFNVDIYITGSNAKLLSGELATYLAGRYVEIKIFPFSFQEILTLQEENGTQKNPSETFLKYLRWGGMPFLYQFDLDEVSAYQYLSDIYDSIILKDIATRNQIRDIELLKRILLFLMSNVGNTFSSTNVVKYLKNEKRTLSSETLYNYIDYCKTACLIYLVQREDIIGKKLLSFQEKIYLTDHGIRQAIYGNNERDVNQILENIIFMELQRRGYQIYVGKNGVQEVDFVAKKPDEKIYIQVSYLLASEDTIEREFTPLETIPDNFPKYVVTMDEITRSRNGIKHINIRDFLLQKEY